MLSNQKKPKHLLGRVAPSHLDPDEVLRFEIVGGAAAPVDDVFVLTFTAQLTVPVGDSQVVVDQGVAHVAVPEHRVEEGLRRKGVAVNEQPLNHTKGHGSEAANTPQLLL